MPGDRCGAAEDNGRAATSHAAAYRSRLAADQTRDDPRPEDAARAAAGDRGKRIRHRSANAGDGRRGPGHVEPAQLLRLLDALRVECAARVVRARLAAIRRELLEDARAWRGGHTGRGAAAAGELQRQLPAHARVL